jgi:carboxylesterase type B
VSAPSNATAPLPVFFFIQGGGFNTLSNPNPDPTHVIAAANYSIVVASFNYRVGPWGFLASKEVEAGGNLNVGLLDQRKALQWVQQYIHLVYYLIVDCENHLTEK